MIKDKDIKLIAKQFKNSDKSILNIKKVFLGFLKGDGSGLISSEIYDWGYFGDDIQDLILVNLKKVFSGKIDEKVFCLDFTKSEITNEDSTYSILENISDSQKDDFKEKCELLCDKITENNLYSDSNIVFIGADCSLFFNTGKKDIFISTICEVAAGKTNLIFKDKLKENEDTHYILQSSLDPIVNLKNPLEGLCYPAINFENIYTQKILYYSKKKNKPNTEFISSYLGCNVTLTAEQEKIFFNSILNEVVGGKMSSRNLYSIYKNLQDTFEEEENDPFIEKTDIDSVISDANIKIKNSIDDAFIKVFGFDNYKFKLKNILPTQDKKSITFTNDDANIQVKPELLKDIKQIQDENGQVFLMVPLIEDASTNGITLPTEEM